MSDIYYTTDRDPMVLTHTDSEDAVDAWANDMWGLELLPDEMEIYEWGPKIMEDPEKLVDVILMDILERLDQKYGIDDYSDGTEPSQKMKDAALKFATVITEEYDVNSYEIKTEFTVNPREILDEELHNMGFENT